ncbi:hypothetical protein I546_2374 [Mycobacterium kansasii 732]|nr:hypothetical protein I546_2374 [Mycobacterium kansasii 732]
MDVFANSPASIDGERRSPGSFSGVPIASPRGPLTPGCAAANFGVVPQRVRPARPARGM